jgi:ADP-ribose pyrophosphatase YjhB (NUDIX family)
MSSSSRDVAVYVTREHPKTAHDQLLVLDGASVPRGARAPGETVAGAAQRVVREATGLEVHVLRQLGEAAGSHFVEAAPNGATGDEWEHRESRCRWVQVRPGLALAGDNGAFLQAIARRRVVAYVTRERDGWTELLTIEAEQYPEEGFQVPAGRIDHWESLEDGFRRELAEETGLTGVRLIRELPEFECTYETYYENHAFHLVAHEETPQAWKHRIRGEGVDAGLVHHCRWVPLTPGLKLWNAADPMLRYLPGGQT